MKFHFWHFFLSVFFAALVVLGIGYLQTVGKLTPWVPAGDVILITLAVMRLIRLFTYDTITQFIRNWFVGWESTSFMGSLGTLINCPWCVGLWFSFVVVFLYYLNPFFWYLILILAISALASSFQVFINLLGWSAEEKKRKAEGISSQP